MKKSQSILPSMLLISFMLPSALYAQLEEQGPAASVEVPTLSEEQTGRVPSPSRWARAVASVKEKLPTRTSLQNLWPLLKDKSQQAASMLKQKSYCLLRYDQCTKRDKLIISNAFGFILGYGIAYRSVLNRIFDHFNIRSTLLSARIGGVEVPIITLTDIFVFITGLTGPVFIGRGAGTALPFWIKDYMNAPNKTLYLARNAVEIANSKLLMLIVAIEAISILQEIAFAFQYGESVSLRNVARYLKMNVQCIWSEKYCPEYEYGSSRRNGLYFWLGFIEGILARKLMQRLRPIPAAPPIVPLVPTLPASLLGEMARG